MSYILDALKKVEHEKSRKASTGGVKSISGDLFLERTPRSSKGGAWKIIVLIVFVSLVTFAASWFMLKGNKKSVFRSSRKTVPAVAPPVVQPGPTATSQAPPIRQAPIPQSPAQTAPAPPANTQTVANIEAGAASAAKAEIKLAKARTAVSQPPKDTVQTIPAPADIKVSGIAWQEEHSARRAVINGFLLQEGKMVSGATILEIYPESVRFKSPTGIFDVRMDSAALSGIPK